MLSNPYMPQNNSNVGITLEPLIHVMYRLDELWIDHTWIASGLVGYGYDVVNNTVYLGNQVKSKHALRIYLYGKDDYTRRIINEFPPTVKDYNTVTLKRGQSYIYIPNGKIRRTWSTRKHKLEILAEEWFIHNA